MVCVSNRVNANLDLIVSAIPLLETLGLLPGQPVDHTHLGMVEDLQLPKFSEMLLENDVALIYTLTL